MNGEMILSLVDEVLEEDPVDFSNLPPNVDVDEVKQTVYLSMLEHYAGIKQIPEEHLRDVAILSILVKLAIENYVLYIEKLQEAR